MSLVFSTSLIKPTKNVVVFFFLFRRITLPNFPNHPQLRRTSNFLYHPIRQGSLRPPRTLRVGPNSPLIHFLVSHGITHHLLLSPHLSFWSPRVLSQITLSLSRLPPPLLPSHFHLPSPPLPPGNHYRFSDYNLSHWLFL